MHFFVALKACKSVDQGTYLLLEITTPLIVYIWRRHGVTWKFGFEFYWDVNISFIIMWPLHSHSYCSISMKNGSNVVINNLFLLIKGLLADHDVIHLFYVYFRMRVSMEKINNNEIYNNKMKESFPPTVQLTKLTNKKWKGQNNMEYSFNIITKWINI
jgi:hypothetical protein